MIKARTDLTVRATHNFTIDEFKGIDYSSGALKANKQRAIQAKNFLYENGSIQKRKGWETLSSAAKPASPLMEMGNGFLHYYENGTDKFFIELRAYTSFGASYVTTYTIDLDGTKTLIDATETIIPTTTNRNFNFYQQGEKVYIIGFGAFFVFGYYTDAYKIYPLSESIADVEYAYIPTTTISIDPEEASTPRVVATLERPNMLTSWRKNTGRSDNTLAATQTFKLDNPLSIGIKTVYANDEFTDNITGWSNYAAPPYPSWLTGGYLQIAAEAVLGDYGGIVRSPDTLITGHKYYVEIKYRTTGADCDYLRVYSVDFGNKLYAETLTPTEDEWYIQYFALNPSFFGGKQFYVKHGYTSATASTMEIDYIKAYDLTEIFNAGNEPSVATFAGYLATGFYSDITVKATVVGLAGADLDSLYVITYQNNDTDRTKLYATHYRRYDLETEVEITSPVLSGTVTWSEVHASALNQAQVQFDDFTYLNWTAADDNLEFLFSVVITERDKIFNCTIGTTFGVDGNTTQLFVSGNTEYKNEDFYSYPLDFTYFPDNNFAQIGSSASSISGYLRLSDGALAIFKDFINGETGIFFRTGTLSLNDTTLEAETVYAVKGGMLDFGCVAPNASAVLAGDPLFLTSNGVYAIVSSTDNTLTNKRFVRERSRFLGDMTWTSAANAVVWENRYYLADGLGNVYVADARFRRNEDQDMDDTFQYEWYHLTDIYADKLFVADGNLYFTYSSTTNIGIAVFNEEYKDTSKFTTAAGNIAITEGAETFTKAATGTSFELIDALVLEDYEEVYQARFTTAGIYAYIFQPEDIASIDEATGLVTITEGAEGGTWENIYKLTDTVSARTPLVIQWASGSGKTNVVTVYVLSVDIATLSFVVASSQTSLVAYDLTTLTGYASIDAFVLPLYNVWLYGGHLGTSAWVMEYPESEKLRLTYINTDNPVSNPLMELKAFYWYDHEWYTPVFDMGTNVYQKELTSITAVVDPENSGEFSVGYETRGKNISAIVHGTGKLEFDDMDFEALTFSSSFIQSYTKRVKTDFNFIIFRFTGKTDQNCVLNGLSIQFKINAKNKGVR